MTTKKVFALLSLISLTFALSVFGQKKNPSPSAIVGGTATTPAVTLSWIPSNGCVAAGTGTGNCTPVTSFIIRRSLTAGTETSYQTVPIANLITCPTGTPPNNTQCWTDANVVPGSTYYYQVESVNQGGASAPSNEASAVIPPVLTVPNPPGTLTASQP